MSKWTDLVLIHGHIEGARIAFEDACEKILRARFPDRPVRRLDSSSGDGGVDIYIGHYGVEPLDIYQCKYFIDVVGKSQQEQIRDSYKRAVRASVFSISTWSLCLPVDLAPAEAAWFDGWAARQEKPVSLLPPGELMVWAESAGLADLIFQRTDSQKIDWMHEHLKNGSIDPWQAAVRQTEADCHDILASVIRVHAGTLHGRYPHLDASAQKASAGDRFETCQYIKSVIVGGLLENEKVWLFTILGDDSGEPVLHRFIRRYALLLSQAKDPSQVAVLSTSELYITWRFLQSSSVRQLRREASWPELPEVA